MKASIQGLGVVGAFGCGVAALKESLLQGPHSPGELIFTAEGEERRMAAYRADPAPLERFVSKRETRRVDHFSKLALLGACLALEDAGALEGPRDDLGLIIASGYGATRTTFGFLDSVIADGDPCASPTLFSNSVHNAAAAHVAIQLRITGPTLTVSQFEMSVASALGSALAWLAEGRVRRVLFGAVDEICPVLGYCHRRFFGASPGPIAPFDLERHSAVPGEGAAFLLLDSGGSSRYGLIAGVELRRIRAGQQLPGHTAFILNVDGHPPCSGHYSRLLPTGAGVAAFTPHYGSFPTGQALDLAVAALALRDGRLPPGICGEALPNGWQPATLDGGGVTCVTCDGDGYFGAIRLTASSENVKPDATGIKGMENGCQK
ncbi:MAG: beta-ketoacyl synthase chain length factor [Deltaproteobacteria bacterium]|nr:beta-ketoacyl synthase chain length factor [Deltaproteobacteria bacterium]